MSKSKGEELIKRILIKEGIVFVDEYYFLDLKYKGHVLRFDFAIIENSKVKFLIEYDGSPHFNRVKFFQKNTNNFKHYQENDRRKNRYCLMNNIPLYRIPYWDFNKINSLEDILSKEYLVKDIWHNDKIAPK